MGKGSYLGGGTLIGWSNPNAVIFRAKLGGRPEKPKQPPRPSALTKAEIGRHFRTALRSRDRVLDDLAPAVLENVKHGVKSSVAMAAVLNAQGYRTALDARWTPELARHLMDLVFDRIRSTAGKPSRPPTDPKRRAKAQTPSLGLPGTARHTSRATSEPRALTADDIAHRLSALGRIVSSD